MCTVHLFTDCGAVSGTSEGEGDHISSPIRVSPHRREPRVVKHSPRHTQGKDYSRLSAKERLYVSKNTIGTVSWDDSEGETGEVEDRASSAHSKDMLGKEIEDIDNRPEGEYCILKT
jgi:hypothetical protein